MKSILRHGDLSKEFIERKALYDIDTSRLSQTLRQIVERQNEVARKGIDKFLNSLGRSIEVYGDGHKSVSVVEDIGYRYDVDMYFIQCRNGEKILFRNGAFGILGEFNEYWGISEKGQKATGFSFLDSQVAKSRCRKDAKADNDLPDVVPFIIPAKQLMMRQGLYNGYVAVPKSNMLWGCSCRMADEKVDAHGGITFSEDAESALLHLPTDWEFITSKAKVPEGWWILGFDTLHCYDDQVNCSREKVIEMTMDLARQLEKLNQ